MKEMSSDELSSALQSNEYGQQYLELVEKVRSENRGPKVRNDGFEAHHVHPRALGGNKGEVLLLTCYEHCLAHVLLAKAIRCKETATPVLMLSSRRVHLNCLEKIDLEEVYKWSEEKRVAKQLLSVDKEYIQRLVQASVDSRMKSHGNCTYMLNSEEAKNKSLNVRMSRYGSYTKQCLTSEARAKAVQTRLRHYGTMQPPEVRSKVRAARIEKYGSEMGCMQTPEVMVKRVLAQRRTAMLRTKVMRSEEFLQWYKKDTYHCKSSAVKDFLIFSGRSLEDYQES